MRASSPPGHSLVVLGIDPGLRATGWAVLCLPAGRNSSPSPKGGGIDWPSDAPTFRLGSQRDQLEVGAYGAVHTEADVPLPERLLCLSLGLREVIERWRPVEAAVEEAFVAANKRVAIAMGEARGVALLAAAEAGLAVFEYSASEVKQAVTGYGRAGKEQVQEMLRLQLGLAGVPQPADASDALAAALCHLMRRRAEARLAGAAVSPGGGL